MKGQGDRVHGVVYSVLRDSYAVRTTDGVVSCKARGRFRVSGMSPVTGDRVVIEDGCITEILVRSSFLPRPPVACFDRMALIIASADPAPSTLVIDKLLAVAETINVTPILVFNKTDIASVRELRAIYSSAGFTTFETDALHGTGTGALKEELKGHFTVFIGNSGVGKSSILNSLDAKLSLKTGEISKKLGRGRHTTRTCEIIELENETLIADTPGFAAVDIAEYAILYPGDLCQGFREFAQYASLCRFRTSCSHTCEKGCAVIDAVKKGLISESRYKNYVAMYESVKNNRPWNVKGGKQ